MVGIDHLEVKVFEVGSQHQAKGLEDFSNSMTLDILPQLILGRAYGGSSNSHQLMISNLGPDGTQNNTHHGNNPHHGNGVGVIGGGNGIGIITASSSFPLSLSTASGLLSSQPPALQSSSNSSSLNLSSLSNLTIGLSTKRGGSDISHHHGQQANPNPPPSIGGGPGSSSAVHHVHLPFSSLSSSTSIDREIIFLGSSTTKNSIVWSERIGNSFGIYCLSSSSNLPSS